MHHKKVDAKKETISTEELLNSRKKAEVSLYLPVGSHKKQYNMELGGREGIVATAM